MRVKVTLKEPHPFPIVEGRANALALGLRGRWRRASRHLMEHFVRERGFDEVKKAIGDDDLYRAPSRKEMGALDQILQELMGDDTAVLISQYLGGSFAYGVALARGGETSWLHPPTADEAQDIAKSPRFLDRQAMGFVEAYGFTQIQSKDSETFAQLSNHLLEALENRQHPSQAARALADDLDGDLAGWTRIARTESARALAAGSFDETRRLGVEYVYVPENGDSCPECQRLILGRVFPLAALERGSNFKRKKADWKAALPLHPNCTCHSIPASQWLIDQALKAGGGSIPAQGVEVEWVPPNQR